MRLDNDLINGSQYNEQLHQRKKIIQGLPASCMNRRSFSLDTFRNRVANLEALPQFALLGVISGIITGLVILALRQSIEIPLRYWLPDNDPENFESLSTLSRFLAPLLGTLLIGLIFTYINRDSRDVGVPHVLERLNYHQGHLSLKNAASQFLAAVISVVSGQSAGREGPAIHLGAAFSSFFGRSLGLPNNSIRILVGCGAAAAISASFNTPIAGVIFAMEVIIMEYTIAGFTPVILASVSAAVVTRLVYGADPAFEVPSLSISSLWDIPFTILLGLIFGALSALFIKIVRFFGRMQRFPMMSRALFAGTATGILAIIAPEIMGISYDSVNDALAGNSTLQILCLIALAKLVATSLPVGLGIPISLIGPTMVIGSCAGAALGIIGNMLMPEHASEVGLYSMLGMGAMMGATLQAPLAALMALLELTANPNIILPAMLTIVTANITAHSFFKEPSVFVAMLANQGKKLNDTPLQQALRRAGVSSLMNENFVLYDRWLTSEELETILDKKPEWIVISIENSPAYLMPAAELARHLEEHPPSESESADEGVLPDETLSSSGPLTDEQKCVVDLLTIPAKRMDLTRIPYQATLQEALETLHSSGFEALYVERRVTSTMKSIAGVLTHDEIEHFYMHKQ
jgi:chloride channel protein, CIC family